MKKFLTFVITLLCAVQCWAANPSFQSFDTNDFIAVAPTIKLRHSVDTGTNIFNNFIIINTNTVIVNTETHVTNVFTSIFNSFVTNVTDNSVTIITNSINNVTFTTNFIDNSTIVISNTFVIFTNTSVTIDGTNVPTINPTIGRIPYKSGTNSFDDSALYFIDPATVGANEVDVNTVGVTNLVTGGFVISVDSGSGYGILTNAPFSDFALWTNIGGILQPTGNPSEIHGKIGGTNYFSFRQVSGTPYLDFVNPVTGTLGSISEVSGAITLADSSQASLFAGTQLLTVLSTGRAYLSRGLNTSEFDIYGYLNGSDYSKLAITHSGTNGAVVFDSQSSGTAGPACDFLIQSNGVTIAKVDVNSGYTGAGNKVLFDNGKFKGVPPVLSVLDRGDFLLTNIQTGNLSAANHDIWTVPSGYWAIAAIYASSTNASSPIVYPLVKTNGIYYFVNHQAQTFPTNALNLVSGGGWVYEEGETVAATNTTVGANLWTRIKYWPKTVSAVKVYKQFGFDGSTTNLAYTCPAGKGAFSLQDANVIYGSSVLAPTYMNGSLSTAQIAYFICNGCTTPGQDSSIKQAPIGTLTTDSVSIPPLLAGDKLFVWSSLNDPYQLFSFIVVEAAIP